MKRGDVVLVDFPFSDATGSKLRPALVVQADVFNASIDDTILALVTRIQRGLATESLIDIGTADGRLSGLQHTSVVDCKNLVTIDQSLVYRQIGRLSPIAMQQVDLCLKAALGIP